jgi:hypothetical protein
MAEHLAGGIHHLLRHAARVSLAFVGFHAGKLAIYRRRCKRPAA